jgi:uncharacterized protein YndB with AHSA1/START domain
MSEQPKPFQVETVVDAPIEVVWRSITSPDLIHQWFGWDYDDLEGEIRFIFVDHAEPSPQDHRIKVDGGQTIELVPDGRRTVVRVVMPGDLTDASWDDIYDGMEEGWRTFFEQLRFYLERHQASGTRRTIYLTGTGRGDKALTMLDDEKELWHELTGTGRGDKALMMLDDEKELWHESRYQRMVVDEAGLLRGVATQQPFDEEGPISLTITTYGLDDAGFAELEKHWTARWSAVATESPS